MPREGIDKCTERLTEPRLYKKSTSDDLSF